jgi:hypothetical protein
MNASRCCVLARRTSSADSRNLHRSKAAAEWGIPTLLLVLTPKCPMCVATYLAMAGIGLSVGAATWLRQSVIAFCLVVIGLLVVRMMMRRRAWV